MLCLVLRIFIFNIAKLQKDFILSFLFFFLIIINLVTIFIAIKIHMKLFAG